LLLLIRGGNADFQGLSIENVAAHIFATNQQSATAKFGC
jgi:hypothetical protein